MEDSLLCK